MSDSIVKSSKSKNFVLDLLFNTAEKTFEESAFVDKSQYKPFNPDDLYQKAGDHSIYEEMLLDDQVSVALGLKKDLVIGSGFDIVAQGDDQDEIVDDIKRALLEDVSPSFNELLEEIISSYEFGFSLTEKIFKTRDDGSLTLSTLKTRHPDTWLIHTDNKGNITKYEQQGVENAGNIKLDPRALIHYVNNRKFQNAYGASDLRPAYAAYFIKKHIIRMYSIFLEKAASPTPIARFDKTVKDATVTKIFNIIKNFQSKTAMTIPKEVEVEFLESSSNGEAYVKGIDMFNMFIGRALTIPDLVGVQGSDTAGGSQALSREQIKIFVNHIQRRRNILEQIINKQIIKPIVLFNFGDIEAPPIFQFKAVSDDNTLEYARLFLDAVKSRAYKASEEEINHFRSLIKFPEGEVVEVEEPKNDNPGDPNLNPTDPINEDSDSIPKDPIDDKEISIKDDQKEDKETFAMNDDGGFIDVPGDFKEKVDFDAIRKTTEGVEAKIKTETQQVIDDLVANAIEQIEKKKILQKKDLQIVDNIKLKGLKNLQMSFKKNLRQLFTDGQKMASNELHQKQNFAEVLLPEEFLKVLESETFGAVGDWEYRFKQDMRITLQQAIKDGKPLGAVIKQLEGISKKNMQTSIERYARTKSTEVLNKGRLAVYDDSEIVQGYQYSAILDGLTTEMCAGLHGKQFAKGDQPNPPLHFNCRSMLIPITTFEKMTPDKSVGGTIKTRRAGDIKVPKKSIDKHIEDNIGKGFSTK